jgi:hypothetical protein
VLTQGVFLAFADSKKYKAALWLWHPGFTRQFQLRFIVGAPENKSLII